MRNNEECPAPCCFTGPGILFLQLFWAAYARSAAFRAQTAAAHSARAFSASVTHSSTADANAAAYAVSKKAPTSSMRERCA